MDSSLLKFVLDLGNALLKLANTGFGTLIIKATLLITSIGALNGLLVFFKKNLIQMAANTIANTASLEAQRVALIKMAASTIAATTAAQGLTKAQIEQIATNKILKLSNEEITTQFKYMTAQTLTTKKSLKTLGASFLAFIKKIASTGLGKVGIAVGIGYGIYKLAEYINKLPIKRLEKTSEKLEETKDKLSELENQLEENENRIKEIKALGSLASDIDKDELKVLEDKNDLLKQQLEYYKKIKEQQEETKVKQSNEITKDILSYDYTRDTSDDTHLRGYSGKTHKNYSYGRKADYNKYIKGEDETESEEIVIKDLEDEIELYNKLNQQKKRTTEENKQLKKSKSNLQKTMEKYKEALNNENLTTEDAKKILDEYNKILRVIDPEQYKLDMLNTILGDNSDEVKAFNSAIKKLAKDGLNMTEEEIEELLGDEGFEGIYDQLEAAGLSIEDVINNFENLDEVVKLNTTSLNDYITQLQSIDSVFSGLNSVVDEFNTYGSLSAETIAKILENDWSQYLDFVNGKLTINTDLLAQNAEQIKQKALALIEEQEQQELLALAQNAVAEHEKQSVENTSAVLNAEEVRSVGLIEAAQNYLKKAKANEIANDVEKGKPIDIDNFKWEDYGVEAEAQAIRDKYAKLKETVSAYSFTTAGAKSTSSKSSSSSKTEKEWWETVLDELQARFKNNEITIDEYINGLSDLLGKLEQGTDAWHEINNELQEQRLSKIESDYKRGTISLEEYISKLKELIKVYKQGTEAWKELADSIKSALQDLAEERKDELEKAGDAAINLIDEEIERLQKIQETEEERYDKLIDEKKAANDETERELELAKLQEALENAKKEKTKRVFREGIGWVYEADEQAIKEAQEALDEFNKEQEISDLEKQKETVVDNIEAQIKALEEYEESWKNVASDYENQQARIVLVQQLGADAEKQLLIDRLTYLEEYKNKYNAIMKEIDYYSNTSSEVISGYTSSGSTSTTTSTATPSAPSLSKGSYVTVKAGSKWYSNSSGGGKSGTAKSGTIKYINSSGSHPYNIDGLGWVRKSDIVGYQGGGVVDYTGLAMLHGTKSKPEFVLNNDQMKNMLANFIRPQTTSSVTSNNSNVANYNFGNIELPNVTNAKQFVTELKSLVNITKHQ